MRKILTISFITITLAVIVTIGCSNSGNDLPIGTGTGDSDPTPPKWQVNYNVGGMYVENPLQPGDYLPASEWIKEHTDLYLYDHEPSPPVLVDTYFDGIPGGVQASYGQYDNPYHEVYGHIAEAIRPWYWKHTTESFWWVPGHPDPPYQCVPVTLYLDLMD
jgi:hypothetical protein